MHLCDCENPTYVYNPYLGEEVRCGCGHCSSCLNKKAKSWISRMSEEARHHKYSFMVNLTYDDEHLPKLYFDENMENVISDSNHNLCIPLQELISLCSTEKELNYLRDRLCHPLGLPFCCSDDISKFLKRLNKHIHDNYTNTYENIRYFCAHEYGPATFRPHCHLELWTDSDAVANDFDKILHSCWTFGDSSCASIFSLGGHEYVAQYVNMSSHLPAVYQHVKLKPRPQFSKFPSIGTNLLLDEEVRNVYDSMPITRTVFNPKLHAYTIVQQSRSFKNRYFPKCPRYSSWPDHDRITLYRATEILPSFDFEQFTDAVNKLAWLDSHNIGSEVERTLYRYTSELKRDAKSPDSYKNSLYRLFLTSKHAHYICHLLNADMSYVVKQIDEYYKRVDYYNLKSMFQYEEAYSKVAPTQDLIYLYPLFVKEFNFYLNKNYQRLTLPDSILYAIESFGIDVLNPPQLSETLDFKNMAAKAQKIYKDTHKSSDISKYRHSDKLRRLNPLLQKILLDYES